MLTMQIFCQSIDDDDNGHNCLIGAAQENVKHANSCKASSSNQQALYEEFNSLPDLTRKLKPCNADYVGDVVFGS